VCWLAYGVTLGPVLGIFKSPIFPTQSCTLAPGDCVVLYTDGAVELTRPDGTEFGIERLAQAVSHARHLPPSQLIGQVIRETQEFTGAPDFADDFTLVVLKRVME
jgi:sigma-B regulation protein RsbU (phosphoserine phosphatase)